MIHQHFKLVDVFTAAENITLGLDEKLDLKATAARIRSICERYGFDLDPNQKIYDMSVSQKQTVEIVKALYRGADILILDEPTAVLTPQETDKLFAVLRSMRDDGKAIVIITHKMHEVEALSDRVAVLRHGQFVGDMLTKDTNAQEMTNMMVGHAVTLNIDRPEPVDPKPRIEVKNLTVRSIDGIVKLDDVSFTANSGEILGIAGHLRLRPEGAARGHRRSAADGERQHLLRRGRRYARGAARQGPAAHRRDGRGAVLRAGGPPRHGPGRQHGSVGQHDAPLLPQGPRHPHRPQVAAQAGRDRRRGARRQHPGRDHAGRRLSGGNVQKVLVGREIASAPTVLLTAYAVRGLDINASYTIYDLINRQKESAASP